MIKGYLVPLVFLILVLADGTAKNAQLFDNFL